MHGKLINFKASVNDFKVANGKVTIKLTAKTKDVVLDQLSDISTGGGAGELRSKSNRIVA